MLNPIYLKTLNETNASKPKPLNNLSKKIMLKPRPLKSVPGQTPDCM